MIYLKLNNPNGVAKTYRWRPLKNRGPSYFFKYSRLKVGDQEGNLNHFEGITLMLFEMLVLFFGIIFLIIKFATTLIMGAILIVYSLVKGIIMLSLTIVLGLVRVLLAIVGVNVKAGMINYLLNDIKKNDQ